MAKPSSLPRWADVGGDIVEPTSGKKDKGWEGAERPAGQYFNWLLNLIYQWLLWISGVAAAVRVSYGVEDGAGSFGTTWTISTSPTWEISGTATSAAAWWVPVRVPIGAVISNMRAHVKSGGATSYVTARMYVFTASGTNTSSTGVSSDTTGGTAWQEVVEADPMTGHTVAAGERVYVALIISGAGGAARKASTVEVDYTWAT